MGHDEKRNELKLVQEVRESEEDRSEDHIVFDFSGAQKANVGDLSWILTARLQSAPTDHVWVRKLPDRTARILHYLKLDHLFRRYPESEGEPN